MKGPCGASIDICDAARSGWKVGSKRRPYRRSNAATFKSHSSWKSFLVSFVAFVCFKNQQVGTNTGIIKLPKLEGIKQCKSMIILRDFSLIVPCLGW